MRSKILENDRIGDFCTSPVDYAATTRKHLRNNSTRAGGRNKRPTQAGLGRSAVSKTQDGAVVRRRLSTKRLKKWRKQVNGEAGMRRTSRWRRVLG